MGVQISGDTGNVLATKGTYSGNLTVGGVLTYEDVTNVDSVGLVTARSGIEIGARPGVAASISVDGNMIISGISTFGGDVQVPDKIIHSGDTNTAIRFPAADTITAETGGSERFRIDSDGRVLIGTTTEGTGSGDDLTVSNSGNMGLTLRSTDSNYCNIYFSDATSGTAEYEGYISYNHGTNSLEFATSHTERLRITSGGDMGLGTNSPASSHDRVLTIAGTNSAELKLTGSNYGVTDTDGADVLFSYGGLYLINNESSGNIHFFTGGSERLRIDSSGRVLIGTSSAIDSSPTKFQIAATDATGSLIFARFSANNYSSYLDFYKSRNATLGSETIVNSGDHLGAVRFYGCDGSGYTSAAEIYGTCDGGTSDGDMPGRITFHTRPDGAGQSMQERLRIDSNGYVTKPTQFHMLVRRNGNQTGYNPSQGFGTGIIYDEVVTAQGTANSALDTSTGRITVPVAGIYFLEGSAYSNTSAFTQGWFIKNGSRLSYSDWMNNSGLSQNFNSNGFHKLAANDTIGFKAYGSQHTSVTIEASIYHTWMRVTLIG